MTGSTLSDSIRRLVRGNAADRSLSTRVLKVGSEDACFDFGDFDSHLGWQLVDVIIIPPLARNGKILKKLPMWELSAAIS